MNTQKVKVRRKETNLALCLSFPVIPDDWDFEKSIHKVKPLIYKWANITEEIADELWIAREILSAPGTRTDLVANGTRLHTWQEYCHKLSINRSTAHRWLALWFPKVLPEPEIDDNAPLKGKYFKLSVGDINNPPKFIPPKVDYIITDPPYGKEYLSLYNSLCRFATKRLNKGGSLFVMIGQTYLGEILNALTQDLEYYWISAYFTPGQAPKLRHKQVNTQWKPILWLVKDEYNGKTITDVFKSDRNDKRFHEWGQSVSGMADIIEKITKPNDVIIDPFLGGGATAEAAVQLKRFIYGFDIDAKAVAITKTRLEKIKDDSTL